ncbi:MAG TPA: NAD(P)H-dependent oxidoreductase [Bryobacteraceae bacterium]|nr:NAD(P)H-dependent oxidoreductase [Bryobacteraceae bacterium]
MRPLQAGTHPKTMGSERRGEIHVAAIGGSVRPGSYTLKALRVVADELASRAGVSVDVIEPATLNLPPPGLDDGSASVQALRERVRAATGVVLATPEYHGSFSSVIKLVIENLGFPSALAGKPVALLGVAQGRIGAVKSLESLTGVCLHVGAIVLPGSVSVANVQTVFDGSGRLTDAAVERQLRRLASGLIDYILGAICPRVALEAMARAKEETDPPREGGA